MRLRIAAVAVTLATACANGPSDNSGLARNSSSGTTSSSGSTSGSGGRSTSSGQSATSSGASTTSGSGGSSGSASSSGATPPEPGVMFPFPQNRHYANCTYPTTSNTDVTTQYATWKSAMVTNSAAGSFERVQRPNNGSDTVSEGIGYGMILAVYMNDQTLFDSLWQFEQQHLDGNGLMNWQISSGGGTEGTGSALDGDEDMAWALVMASKQWDTSPTLGSYATVAEKQIGAIWSHEISVGSSGSLSGPLPVLGDSWGSSTGWPSQGQGGINVSYFAPAYYRVFATVDAGHDWMGAVDTVYSVIDANLNDGQGNATNGIVPGFSTVSGGEMNGQPYTYQYDACRTPFRIGFDWCVNGEARAQQYLSKIVGFFATTVGLYSIVDGYDLNGTKTGSNFSSPFFGPAAVGGMSSSTYSMFVQQAYPELVKNQTAGAGEYYAESWTTLSMLMLSGNFLDYTQLP